MTLPPFLDAHLHLQDKRYEGHIDAVIQRAIHSGVKRLFCNATSEADWQKVIDLAGRYRFITPFLGVHPWYSDSLSIGWQDRLQKMLTSSNGGIGETGLDKKCSVDMNIQIDIFGAQLDLAQELNRPIVIHCIRCWGKLIELLEDKTASGRSIPVIIHSFSGSQEVMKRLVALGCHLSFSARLNDPGYKRLRDVFKKAPLDHILLETDSPDQLFSLSAQKGSPKIIGSDQPAMPETGFSSLVAAGQSGPAMPVRFNEPAFIVELYRTGALLKNMKLDKFARQIWKNGTIYTS